MDGKYNFNNLLNSRGDDEMTITHKYIGVYPLYKESFAKESITNGWYEAIKATNANGYDIIEIYKDGSCDARGYESNKADAIKTLKYLNRNNHVPNGHRVI